jgi:membrane protease YdiL (CAAX protease family)
VLLPPRLPPLPPLPVRARDLALLLVLILASVIAIPTVASLLRPDVRLSGLFAVMVLFVVQSLAMLFLTWLVILRPYRLRLADIGLRPTYKGWNRLAVAGGFLCLPLVGVVNYVVQEFLGAPIENPQLRALAPEGFSWTSLIAMLLLVGVLVPFIEEIIFRGLVFRWLRRHLRFAYAAPVSALFFSLVHGIPELMPALAVVGLVLAGFAERSGSLWPAIVLHGTFNGLMTLSYYAALAGGAGF